MTVQDIVPVFTADGMPDIKGVINSICCFNRHIPGQVIIEPADKCFGGERRFCPEADNLTLGVNAGISAAGRLHPDPLSGKLT